ncbi:MULTISPECIES: DMT family transporter [Mariniradius]|nr:MULTISPECIES: DMT family transporter [Mariniradius]MCF1749577.1 DMT family transporter [Mariniradius sediminis]
MNKIYLVLALVAGFVLPLQIAFNNKLTSFSGNAITSSLISFSVGTIALVVYSISNPSAMYKSFLQIGQSPPYAWLGGLVGAFYIISTIVASPRIGIAVFLGLVVCGQMVTSLLLDHYGLFGMPVKPFNWVKGIGLILVIAGIFLIKK